MMYSAYKLNKQGNILLYINCFFFSSHELSTNQAKCISLYLTRTQIPLHLRGRPGVGSLRAERDTREYFSISFCLQIIR